MNLKFTETQTKKIIKAYYKMSEGKEVEIRPIVSRGCEGLYETPCTNVKILVTSKIELLGESIIGEVELNKSEVTDILKLVLSEQGFEVESISYNAGIDTGYRGEESYFHGINVEVKQPTKQKIKQFNQG